MTIAFYGLCLALMLVMRLAPHSPLGRWLHLNFVEEPLARLAALERRHLIFFAIVLAMAIAAGETVAIYGSFEWAMVSAFDMSVYLDAMAVTVALGAAARVRGAVQVLRLRLTGRRKRRSTARQRRVRAIRRKVPAQNDDDHPALALAA